ncbi:MAG: hypothetical protein EXR72_20180 [Myxococcales bacterium]|nr:hypothetical protein [Myxococcales bacterium]
MPSLRTGRLRLRLRLRDEQEPARGPPPLLSTRSAPLLRRQGARRSLHSGARNRCRPCPPTLRS